MQDDIQITDEIYEAAWDDDLTMSETTAEEDQLTPEVEAEEVETGAEQNEGETQTAETEGTAEKAENTDLRFLARHLGKAKEYDWNTDREEIITNVQKGMDYDRIRQERDSMRAELPELRELKGFLEELAQDAGTSVAQMVEDIRTNRLEQAERKAGRVISTSAAREQIRREKAARDQAAVEANKEPENDVQVPDAVQQDMMNFVRMYPDVKPTEIPQDVWADVNRGISLVTAYTKHQNKELKSQIETMKHQEKIKDRSTGSRRTSGNNTQKNIYDAAWDAADY